MEEVDNIIIDSLKNLNCNFDEDVVSIKDFNPDIVVEAIVTCLKAITPGLSVSHKLPPSMSLRLKLASSLAEHIKELGFRGDMGYQTILYCNEVEVRRVLMFLIERLPRESGEVLPNQDIGYVPRLIKQIEEKVKVAIETPWISHVFLKNGARVFGDSHLKQSYEFTYPLKSEHIEFPHTQSEAPEDLKQYWILHLPDVTKQCSEQNLIPSLLFKDTDFSIENTRYLTRTFNGDLDQDILNKSPEELNLNLENKLDKITNLDIKEDSANEIQLLLKEIECSKDHLSNLKYEIQAAQQELQKLLEVRDKEENVLKDIIAKCKIKSKTLTVLSKEENLMKLQNLVDNSNERLSELAKQWKEVQMPLLEQYEVLKTNLSAQESKLQEEQSKIKNLKEKNQQLTDELKEKEKLEKQLKQECERFSRNTNRSAYTKRILEIIGNIKKQNEEIQKVLKDTKGIQKDINNLNGQVDRSFTLSDELIFRNAKHDEMSRKAYKLLVTLRNDCGDIIQAVTELGQTERESRNLQEQIDAEVGKATAVNLDRVNTDLANVKKETALLLKQFQV